MRPWEACRSLQPAKLQDDSELNQFNNAMTMCMRSNLHERWQAGSFNRGGRRLRTSAAGRRILDRISSRGRTHAMLGSNPIAAALCSQHQTCQCCVAARNSRDRCACSAALPLTAAPDWRVPLGAHRLLVGRRASPIDNQIIASRYNLAQRGSGVRKPAKGGALWRFFCARAGHGTLP